MEKISLGLGVIAGTNETGRVAVAGWRMGHGGDPSGGRRWPPRTCWRSPMGLAMAYP